MCTNSRFVYNKYIHQSIFVPCGKCPACLQEKANRRKLRLLNHSPEGYDVFFFHLTYADEYCPYIYLEDLIVNPEESINIDIYRSMDAKQYYNRNTKRNETRFIFGEQLVSSFEYDELTQNEFDRLYPITDEKNKVAVLVYEDVQKFFKRLRQRAYRNNYVKTLLAKLPLYYFVTGEYGENKSRSHWHILLYVPRMRHGFSWWRAAVVACWSYGRDWLTKKNFEYAISPQKYISQYINCSVDVSRFLLRYKIRPTWHYSHFFGRFNPAFQLSHILENIRRKTIEYTQIYPIKGGGIFSIALPIPTYITNRWFPKFKGLCKISFFELPIFIRSLTYKFSNAERFGLDFSDCKDIHKHLMKCFERYRKESGNNIFDYCIDYINLMKSRFHYNISKQLQTTFERDIVQSYDNVALVRSCKPYLFNSFFNGNYFNSPFIVDSNKFDERVRKTVDLTDKYNKFVKQKQLSVCQKS